MATYKTSRFKTYRPKHESGLAFHGPTRGVKSHSAADLAAVAAASDVTPTVVEPGKRTVSDKQAYLALHATDEYRYASRNFLGEIEAKLGMAPSQRPDPVAPDTRTDEEREAERSVKMRRYWARKRRRD